MISLVLMVSFGVLGVGYAQWTQNLSATVSATISDLSVTTNGPAEGLSSGGATLHGTLNGIGNDTSPGVALSFDYGLTTAYGSTVTGDPATWGGAVPQAFTGSLSGLSPNTTYHYRAKAVGYFTTCGADDTFITADSQGEGTFITAVTNDSLLGKDPNVQGSGGTTGSSWNFTTNPWTWNGARSSQDKASTTLGSTGSSDLVVTILAGSTIPAGGYYPAVAVSVQNTGAGPTIVTATVNIQVLVGGGGSGKTPNDLTIYYRGGILDVSGHTLAAGESMTGEINAGFINERLQQSTEFQITIHLDSEPVTP